MQIVCPIHNLDAINWCQLHIYSSILQKTHLVQCDTLRTYLKTHSGEKPTSCSPTHQYFRTPTQSNVTCMLVVCKRLLLSQMHKYDAIIFKIYSYQLMKKRTCGASTA